MTLESDEVGNPGVRYAVVMLTAMVVVGLGGACASGGRVTRAVVAKAATPTSAPDVVAKAPTSTPAGVARYRPTTPVLDAAAPVRLEIPSIGVSTNLVALGLNADG